MAPGRVPGDAGRRRPGGRGHGPRRPRRARRPDARRGARRPARPGGRPAPARGDESRRRASWRGRRRRNARWRRSWRRPRGAAGGRSAPAPRRPIRWRCRRCSSRPTSSGILVGAGDPPSADERRALGELAALVAAAAGRRAESTVILAGGMAEHLSAFGDVGVRRGEVMLGPAAQRGVPGGPLADLLIELALPRDDSRRALGAGAQALAEVLDRRVDVVEIGFDGGARAVGRARGRWRPVLARPGVVPEAALAPAEPDDAVIDRVSQWSTWGADRHRLRDRMRELRIAPWADATGEGVALRMAAARAALGWLGECDAGVGRPAGGRSRRRDRWRLGRRARPRASRWRCPTSCAGRGRASSRSTTPGSSLRSGRSRTRTSDGRWCRPRRRPAGAARDGRDARPGMRHGRSAGAVRRPRRRWPTRARPRCRAAWSSSTCRRARPPWPSSGSATRVRLGGRGRHFAIDVTGGLGGLVVDLRDVPLRLPDRADLRGELLEAWQTVGRDGPRRDERPPTADVRLVPARPLVTSPVDALFALTPGDRPLVAAGDSVVVGAPIAERLRDPRPRGARGTRRRGAAARRPLGRAAATRRRARLAAARRVLLARPLAGRAAATSPTRSRPRSPASSARCGPGSGSRSARPVAGSAGSSPSADPTRGRLQAGPDGELRAGRARRRRRPGRSSSSARGSMPRR